MLAGAWQTTTARRHSGGISAGHFLGAIQTCDIVPTEANGDVESKNALDWFPALHVGFRSVRQEDAIHSGTPLQFISSNFGYDIRTATELLGHEEVATPMILGREGIMAFKG